MRDANFPFSSDRTLHFAALALLVAFGLTQSVPTIARADVTYSEQREACTNRNPLRNAYFGDLHVHTQLSFDAYSDGARGTPADAYAYARGSEIGFPPFDADRHGAIRQKLDTPLDFAAVTDHAEFLGEVGVCTEKTAAGAAAFDGAACTHFRMGGFAAIVAITLPMTQDSDTPIARDPLVCGEEGSTCVTASTSAWEHIQRAAEAAYDRTETCEFTSFVGYEHTGSPGGSNYHRNVIFRNHHVPAHPSSYIETPKDYLLFDALDRDCVQGTPGCDVLVIPHNSNLANGKMFNPAYANAGAPTLDAQRLRAHQRARFERLFEIFQHKGQSECVNGLGGILGAPDELCEIEQVRRVGEQRRVRGEEGTTSDCRDGVGDNGMLSGGCISRYDFARGVLIAGLEESVRLGVNPYQYGLMASTDTHSTGPGAVSETEWLGHIGREDKLENRLDTRGGYIPSQLRGNPGGLIGVWALENSRDALFDAMKRRETFGTSGPRIAPRLYAGWDLPEDFCDDPNGILRADTQGVPMGGQLPPPPEGAAGPVFAITALADPAAGSAPLERIQIVKGWLDTEARAHVEVFDVAGSADAGPKLDMNTCELAAGGTRSLCTVYRDPDFDPRQPAWYYARIVETPTCRWSFAQCTALPAAERPPACTNDAPKTIREMAWTSPVWWKLESPR